MQDAQVTKSLYNVVFLMASVCDCGTAILNSLGFFNQYFAQRQELIWVLFYT